MKLTTTKPRLSIPVIWGVFCLLSTSWAQQEPAGFGHYEQHDTSCLTAGERAHIKELIRTNVTDLKKRGTLHLNKSQAVLFIWPLRPAAILTDYGYHGVSNFVDHDVKYPDKLQDYMCGDRTYDQANGYNHRGTDFFLWPFAWNKMENDAVEVVAAASGVIVLKQDGNFDHNCGFADTGSWNAIYVQHYDGSVSWYGHLKKNSLTTKTVGDSVAAGEYLGVVGSSGRSTGPHLHFEVYDADDHLIDPYAGPCNQWNSESWWAEQPRYNDSAINAVMTHSAPPEFEPCPSPDNIHARNRFHPGETAYFAAYYRDQLDSQVSKYTIFRPDGSIFRDWTHHSNVAHYSASYWYWSFTIPVNAPTGEWTFQVLYEGKTYSHTFAVAPENHPPLSFHLLQPADHTRLNSLAEPVAFSWQAAKDPDADSLIYDLHVTGADAETTVTAIRDSFYVFQGADFFLPNTEYTWFAQVGDGEFSTFSADTFTLQTPLITAVRTRRPETSQAFALLQNYPNPFNPTTRIRYALAEPARVKLTIFNLRGEEVLTLVDAYQAAGGHSVQWRGENLRGQKVPSGIYIYRLFVGERKLSAKMLLIR